MTIWHYMATRIGRILKPKSLQYQLLTRSLYILLGLFSLVGLFQHVFLSRLLYENTARSVMSELHQTPFEAWTNSHQNQPNPLQGPYHNPNWNPSTPITSLAIVDADCALHTVFEFAEHGAINKLPNTTYRAVLQTGQATWQIVKDAHGDQEMLVLVPMQTHAGNVVVMQASSPVGELQTVLTNQIVIYILLGLLAFAIGIITFIPTLRKTLHPLAHMVDTVSRVNAGNLEERFEVDGPQSEINLLAHSFNDMLMRLHDSFEKERQANEKMRQFIADASHELRTPLTSIHGFLEVLLRGAADNAEQLKKSLNSMFSESERMNKLVQDLISLARLDREPQFTLEIGQLGAVILDMEPQLRVIAGERKLSLDIDASVKARFEPDRMKQVLLNLFNNAVQHTHPTEGHIDIRLTQSDCGVKLTVSDNGHGIPAEHLPHLFERFYRVDAARSRKDGGVGLGLAITKSIVEHHGGRISCESTAGQGTSFHVCIPNS